MPIKETYGAVVDLLESMPCMTGFSVAPLFAHLPDADKRAFIFIESDQQRHVATGVHLPQYTAQLRIEFPATTAVPVDAAIEWVATFEEQLLAGGLAVYPHFDIEVQSPELVRADSASASRWVFGANIEVSLQG